jgi:hypothetical protein
MRLYQDFPDVNQSSNPEISLSIVGNDNTQFTCFADRYHNGTKQAKWLQSVFSPGPKKFPLTVGDHAFIVDVLFFNSGSCKLKADVNGKTYEVTLDASRKHYKVHLTVRVE